MLGGMTKPEPDQTSGAPSRSDQTAALVRVRWAVRGALVVGVAASVVANVLHARNNPISQAIAAWPPLALLLTVELISRVPVHRRGLAATRYFATALIACIAGWVSYWHMVGVAARYGEVGGSPYLMPVSVDGLIVVASICLVELGARIAEQATAADQTGQATVVRPDQPPAGGQPAAAPVQDVTPPEQTAPRLARRRTRGPRPPAAASNAVTVWRRWPSGLPTQKDAERALGWGPDRVRAAFDLLRADRCWCGEAKEPGEPLCTAHMAAHLDQPVAAPAS